MAMPQRDPKRFGERIEDLLRPEDSTIVLPDGRRVLIQKWDAKAPPDDMVHVTISGALMPREAPPLPPGTSPPGPHWFKDEKPCPPPSPEIRGPALEPEIFTEGGKPPPEKGDQDGNG